MIQVTSVTKHYGDTPVLRSVSLTLPNEGVTALIGPNGAGKSTLLGIMSRLQKPDSGQVLIDNLDVHSTDNALLARKLAILRQDNPISLRLTVFELVAFGRYPYSQGRLTDEDTNQINQALGYLNLHSLQHRFLDELSGGQRQRACIAMVLCQNTDYLLLDEPLNNLDMKHAVDIMKLLRRAADELGKHIVLVLHDINFASCYADTIVAMDQGRIAHQGTPDELMTPAIMRDLYGIEMSIQRIQNKPVGFYHL